MKANTGIDGGKQRQTEIIMTADSGCVVVRIVHTCMVFYELDFIIRTNRLCLQIIA